MPPSLSVEKSLNQARQAVKKQDWLTATGLYRSVLDRFPGNKKAAKAVSTLKAVATTPLLQQANAARAAEDWRALVELVEAAAFLAPELPEIQAVLVEGYIEADRYIDALETAQNLVRAFPENATFLTLYGRSLHELDRVEDARNALEKALSIAPKEASTLRALAILERSQGNLDATRQYLETAIALDPNDAFLHRNLAMLSKPVSKEDEGIVKMRAALAALGADNPKSIPLYFALFDMLHHCKEHDAAFSYLEKGNALQSAKRPFDFKSEAVVAGLSKVQFAQPIAPIDAPSETRLIFVTGLPRSGTTLTERILSCAPEVQACGEVMIVQRAVLELLGDVRQRKDLKVKPEDFQALRRRILDGFASISDGRPIQVDKLPLNFRWIGYICAALPEARIVHMQRDLRAVAWSLYRHVFRGTGHDFMHRPEDIARFMVLHRDLMDHWRKIYGARVFDLDYADLVQNQTDSTQRLAHAVGLDWTEAWLSPEKANTHVRTSSVLQVTKPIYQNSDESWRIYERQLQPLMQALDTAGLT